jgi:integrase/recombinase XerD
MISTQFILRTDRPNKKGECPLNLQFIENGKRKAISMGIAIHPNQWDAIQQLPVKKHPHFMDIRTLIETKKSEITTILLEHKTKKIPISTVQLIRKIELNKKILKADLFNYFEETIQRLYNSGKIGYGNVFKETKRQLVKFSGKTEMSFHEIDYLFLVRFDEWSLKKEVSLNSIFLYLRTLKTLINYAKKEGVLDEYFNPFKNFNFIKYRKVVTRKKALTKNKIDLLKELKFDESDSRFSTKFYFLFSYYCRGINFKDMAYLKWSNISDNCLSYTRAKTNQPFIFRLENSAIEILNHFKKYYANQSSFIFPILSEIHITPLQQDYRIKKVLKQVNKDLKSIALLIGEESNLTFYAGRHSFATISKKAGVSIAHIQDAMGHTTERTTNEYLERFGNDELDDVFKNVL